MWTIQKVGKYSGETRRKKGVCCLRRAESTKEKTLADEHGTPQTRMWQREPECPLIPEESSLDSPSSPHFTDKESGLDAIG